MRLHDTAGGGGGGNIDFFGRKETESEEEEGKNRITAAGKKGRKKVCRGILDKKIRSPAVLLIAGKNGDTGGERAKKGFARKRRERHRRIGK